VVLPLGLVLGGMTDIKNENAVVTGGEGENSTRAGRESNAPRALSCRFASRDSGFR
jgi:hypothetical protein